MGPYESAGPTFVIWAITLSTADPFQKNIIDPISFLQREVARKGDGVFWLPPSTDFSSLKARHSSVGAACCTLSSAHCYAQQRMRWHSARARRYAKNLWTCCRAWRIGRLNTGSHTKHHKKSPSAHFFVEKRGKPPQRHSVALEFLELCSSAMNSIGQFPIRSQKS